MSKKLFIAALAAAATSIALAHDLSHGPVDRAAQAFANLPDGVRFPEGIAANPDSGDLYVGTFDFGPNANKLVRISREGKTLAQKDFGGAPLLGLEYRAGKVYILNFGASKLQRIAADFDASTPVETVASIPSIGPPPPRGSDNPDGTSDTITFASAGFPAPNAMVFDRAGNLYISDSFQGAIFRVNGAATCATPCTASLVSHDPLLATAGFPPFGANGLALNDDESLLYIANTGDNRILKMTLPGAVVSVFVESIHGADGLLFREGILWVCANQGDQVLGLNAVGRVLARVSGFAGIDNDGAPRSLLFPASVAYANGNFYVSNLALPLRGTLDEPEGDVTRWNIARFSDPFR